MLKLDVNLVVFIEPKGASFVRQARQGRESRTLVINSCLDDLPSYKDLPRVTNIMRSVQFRAENINWKLGKVMKIIHIYYRITISTWIKSLFVGHSMSLACCFFFFFYIRTLCCRIDFFSPVRTKIYGGGLTRLLNEGPVCPEGRPLKALIFWGLEWVNTSLGILPLLTHESELYLWIDGYCLGLNWLWQLTWSEVNTCI